LLAGIKGIALQEYGEFSDNMNVIDKIYENYDNNERNARDENPVKDNKDIEIIYEKIEAMVSELFQESGLSEDSINHLMHLITAYAAASKKSGFICGMRHSFELLYELTTY
jgi:hypothetical protein